MRVCVCVCCVTASDRRIDWHILKFILWKFCILCACMRLMVPLRCRCRILTCLFKACTIPTASDRDFVSIQPKFAAKNYIELNMLKQNVTISNAIIYLQPLALVYISYFIIFTGNSVSGYTYCLHSLQNGVHVLRQYTRMRNEREMETFGIILMERSQAIHRGPNSNNLWFSTSHPMTLTCDTRADWMRAARQMKSYLQFAL